ncbi:phage tail protein [Serratia proteamaculans]|uniref:phage tail protein n=1 Tax=Serratia proteamaculans TaxID=28151 RepID=UPI001C59081B|nr:phage tail protein [Serratia proteamaculans]WEO91489.1 phage tail protein [Serratia proteamaculans]
MGDKKFISLITKSGAEKLAAAAVSGEKVGFTQMAVGDGGGIIPTPDENQTALVNECFRTYLNSLKVVDSDKNIIAAEMIIPPQIGGFTMREAALFDDAGICLAIASMPETYKPLLYEGSCRFSIIRIWLSVSSTGSVELITDPGIVLATIEDVTVVKSTALDYTDKQIDEHAKSRNHPDATLTEKGFTQLSNAIDSDDEAIAATPAAIKTAIAEAVRQAWELSHPVGLSLFFFENVDPNALWNWSTWEYTGEDRSVRIAKRDGSNVGQTGGNDTITLQKANLPAVQINVSGQTSEKPEQVLNTAPDGNHRHGGVPSKENPWEIGGDIGQLFNPANLGETDEAGEHAHEYKIPPHKHGVTGKTDNLGEGAAINVVEAHTFQMCWRRVA